MHSCPNCYEICRCHGDAAAAYTDLEKAQDNCTHCEDGADPKAADDLDRELVEA